MRTNYGLMPGDKLTVMDAFINLDDPGSSENGKRTRECTVIKEYRDFILADFGLYRESINKASIDCKEVLIWEGWKKK